MSQDSPAKHERIERHLMRQRGAGSRAVNADFGFSFAGFSVPASQETTPRVFPSEPPMKRRKTIAQDLAAAPGQHQPRSDAFDRRAQTNATRAKRRLVVEVDDEAPVGRVQGVETGEDSFVTGWGAKSRKDKRRVKVDEEQKPEALEELVPVNKPAIVRKSKKAGPGSKAKKKGLSVPKSDEVAGEVRVVKEEPARALGPTTKPKRRARQAVEETADMKCGDTNEVEVQRAEDEDPGTLKGPKPELKLRRKEAEKTGTKDSHKNADPVSEQQDEETERAAGTRPPPQKRATRVVRTGTTSKSEICAPEEDDHEVELEVATQTTKKTKSRPKAKGQRRQMELSAAAPVPDRPPTSMSIDDGSPQQSLAAAPDPERKRKAQSRRKNMPQTGASYESPASGTHKEDESDEARLCPVNESRPTVRSKVVKRPGLENTPPKLKRRPLQETDANRSPSPRKAVDKPDPKSNISRLEMTSKRKRKDLGGGEQAVPAERPRKSRKLRVEPDELQPGGEAAVKSDPDVNGKQTRAAPATESAPTLSRAVIKATMKTTQDDTVGKGQQDCEEENIDWLFAAPEAKPRTKTKTTAPLARPPAAPRKMKMVDIDLDDLIANVAAFAQSNDAGVLPTTQSKVRKGRKR